MRKVLVLGYFGYRTNQLDGQTIKTREIYNLISDNSLCDKVLYFDTQDLKYSKASAFLLLKMIIISDVICYLPGKNNLKYLFPLIYFLSLLFKFDIIYIVVGGWLYEYITNKRLLISCLRNIKVLLVESVSLKNKLENGCNFNNVELFPNFRLCDYTPVFKVNSKLKLVFMARIIKDKGVDYIFDFASFCVEKGLDKYIDITFYGPIGKEYESEFFSQLSCFNFTRYNGVVPYQSVYQVLNDYDVLLLPTRYEGEGFPGSIIDAYKAGLPVIVSNWKDLPEFVEEGKTGFVFDLSSKTEMFNVIIKLMNNHSLLFQMKNYSFNKSMDYSPVRAWDILKSYL